MSCVLNDLFIIPGYDEATITVTFTAPEGGTEAHWRVLDQGKVIRPWRTSSPGT